MDTLEAVGNGFSPVALIVFSSVFVALYAAHQVGDHWVQAHWQACGKGDRSRQGQFACLSHVASLTLTKLVALVLLWYVTRLPIGWTAAPALLLDAATHYWADRRYTLQRLAERFGKGDFWKVGEGHLGSGAYSLDQSWHIGWLFVTSLIIAGGSS
ncbi:transcriptional regulator [Nonomuraea sp. NPDC049646]|uniref:transcriptional regulator n=1 Tax=unclassified Nonomuraea TaxID=2593643 RepID=UPI0037B3659D